VLSAVCFEQEIETGGFSEGVGVKNFHSSTHIKMETLLKEGEEEIWGFILKVPMCVTT
jgi:hypothetical protein